MNKKMMSAIGIAGALFFSLPLLADDSHSHAAPSNTEKAEKKTGRKKRQLMCKDCGKPEKNCECKGDEHRKGKDDSHGHAEGEKEKQ